MHIHRLPTVLATALLISATLPAQVTPIPGSGCPSMPGVTISGSGKIGTGLSCVCPPSIDRMRVLIGIPGNTIVFNKPFMCANSCAMPMTPLFLLSSNGWKTPIPNDRTLIGQKLVLQCLQTSLNRSCVVLTGASEVKVN